MDFLDKCQGMYQMITLWRVKQWQVTNGDSGISGGSCGFDTIKLEMVLFDEKLIIGNPKDLESFRVNVETTNTIFSIRNYASLNHTTAIVWL